MGAQAVRLSNVDIDNALEKRHFELLFQPIFDLSNGTLARVETFVRWRHESLGILPPGAFISFFETQGRMSELTRYVLEQTLDSYVSWRGPHKPGFSINLALSDLTDESFVSHFAVLLREKQFPAELVTLECPMPPVTMEKEKAVACFESLARTGARLAIEVRGRANDLVRTIHPFPFAEIKTGGAAILRFARTVRGPGLSAISELLDLAEEKNAAITAVGVEDQASLSALKGLSFDAAQGNHLGRAGPLKDFDPARINEVRVLLGLSPLPETDLEVLVRTDSLQSRSDQKGEALPGHPNTKIPKSTSQATSASASPQSHEIAELQLVNRLNAGLADDPNNERARAEKRKAAAIKRARQKQSLQDDKTENAKAPLSDGDNAVAQDIIEPHDLQNLLSKEFEDDNVTDLTEPDKSMLAQPGKRDEENLDQDHGELKIHPSDAPGNSIPVDPEIPSDIVTPARIVDGPPAADQGEQKSLSSEREQNEPTTKDKGDAAAPESTPRQQHQNNSSTADAPPVPVKHEIKHPELGSLSIQNARAFFKPGIRVAGPVAVPVEDLYDNFEHEAAGTPRADRVLNDAGFDEEMSGRPGVFQRTVGKAAPASDIADDFNSPGARAKPDHDADGVDTPPPSHHRADFASERRQMGEEKQTMHVGILQRKYQLFSGYFWPRPWRKAWAAYQKSKALTGDANHKDD